MNSLFLKRIGAYLFDLFIVSFFVAIITMGFKESNKNIKKMNELISNLNNEKVITEENTNEFFEINYVYQKSMIPSNIVNIVISIGYFIIFVTLNKGQSLGKKVFNIEIVNNDDKAPSLFNILGRSIFLYGIMNGIINIFCVKFLDVKMFNYTSAIVNYIYYGFIIICFFMVMYKKNGRGLHDIIGKTYVKEKVK